MALSCYVRARAIVATMRRVVHWLPILAIVALRRSCRWRLRYAIAGLHCYRCGRSLVMRFSLSMSSPYARSSWSCAMFFDAMRATRCVVIDTLTYAP